MAVSSIMSQSLLSANNLGKIARVQQRARRQAVGHAGVLNAEIKLDGARGGDTKKKQEELEETNKRISSLEEKTMNTLTTAKENLKKSTKETQETQKADEIEGKKKKGVGRVGRTKKESKAESGKEITEQSTSDVPVKDFLPEGVSMRRRNTMEVVGKLLDAKA